MLIVGIDNVSEGDGLHELRAVLIEMTRQPNGRRLVAILPQYNADRLDRLDVLFERPGDPPTPGDEFADAVRRQIAEFDKLAREDRERAAAPPIPERESMASPTSRFPYASTDGKGD